MDFFRKHKIRTNRMPVNPADKCTIVSVFPKEINEEKPTLTPGRFKIHAAPDNDFEILVIGSASWFKENMDTNMPFLEIPTGSLRLAQSIIEDFIQATYAATPDSCPGLFYVPGAYNKSTIIKSAEADQLNDNGEVVVKGKIFPVLLQEARERQKRWFQQLVALTDMDWVQTGGNPRVVSNDARLAARKLNLDKPWMKDQVVYDMVNCQSCGTLVNPNYPVCATCKNPIMGLAKAVAS